MFNSNNESIMDYKNVCSIFQKWIDNTPKEDVLDMIVAADIKFEMKTNSPMKRFYYAAQYIAYSLLNYETGEQLHRNSNGKYLKIDPFTLDRVKEIANELVQSIYPYKILFK